MPKSLDLRHDGKTGLFFDEYVYGRSCRTMR